LLKNSIICRYYETAVYHRGHYFLSRKDYEMPANIGAVND